MDAIMNATFQREKDKNYVVIKDEGVMDDFTINMLCENQISGFAKVECKSFNGEKLFYYNVSESISLADLSKDQTVDTIFIRRILQAVLSALKQVHPYFLHPDGICLDPDYIFIRDNQILLCYYPQELSLEENLYKLAEEMLTMVNNSDETAVVLIYQFYMLTKESNLSAQAILSKILFGQENIESTKQSIFMESDQPDCDLLSTSGVNTILGEDNKNQNSNINEYYSMDRNSEYHSASDTLHTPKQDSLPAFIWYILLILASFIYGVFTYFYLNLNIRDFFLRREGVLSVTFLIFGFLGLLLDRFVLKRLRNMKS